MNLSFIKNKRNPLSWAAGAIKKHKIVSIILVVAIAAGVIVPKVFFKKSETVQNITRVTRGDITKTIEGSGTIEAIEQYDITSLVNGEILEDYFEEGQMLNKGDLMYQLDSSDLDNSIKKARTSLEKSQNTYNDSVKTLNDLSVKSTVGGVIKTLYVSNGDKVSSGTKVADIINEDQMLLKINFLAKDAAGMYKGQTANVSLVGSFSNVTGKVQHIASGSMVNSYGVAVTAVQILVDNPGGIMPNDTATAVVGDYACNAPGTFTYSESVTVVTNAAGTVSGLSYKEGDAVREGSLLATLISDTTSSTVTQNALSVQDAQIALDTSVEQLDDYKITAPIAGKVVKKTSKAGDKISTSGNSTTVMAIIADLSTLIFEISVDELDVASIKVGQEVKITADALSGQTFTGRVDNISVVGTSSNGVTSYPVKVVVDNSESTGLITGMNVNAEIVVENKEDVLTLVETAVEKGSKVTLYKNGKAETTKTTVETGLTDGTNVEIVSGLSEGDEVVIPQKAASTTTNNMMPGGGGEPPSGGGGPGGPQ